MKAALDIVLFLLTGIVVGAGTVGAGVVGACAVAGGGCWWWFRRRRRGRPGSDHGPEQ
jgi:uncharacterized Fe-S cluster-containing radical SAM superfamily protein